MSAAKERPERLMGWTRENWSKVLAANGGKDGVARIM